MTPTPTPTPTPTATHSAQQLITRKKGLTLVSLFITTTPTKSHHRPPDFSEKKGRKTHPMEEKEKKQKKKKQQQQNKKPKHQHPNDQSAKPPASSDFSFKPAADVKGLRFGGQFVVKSFTVRRARHLELLKLLSLPPNSTNKQIPVFPSATAFIPTNFTILAHHAWHTLTLGLGTKKSKVVVFVFESEALKAAAERTWPAELPLGELNKRLIRGSAGCEMARFKFRKGCVTFYVYAARREGSLGFSCSDDLRTILQSVVALNDFLDHTAMLATPTQRSISYCSTHPMAMAAH